MNKKFEHKNIDISKCVNNQSRELYLENTYNLCVKELGLQQSKRDQIIAFYIAVISFVIPSILEMELLKVAKALGFILIYLFGIMLIKVIMRYRVYKEVYWITCKTITQLYNIKTEMIDKKLVQHVFYKTLEKNANAILVRKEKSSNKINLYKTHKKIQNSAEAMLYNTLVFMSSIALWIGVFIYDGQVRGVIIASILVVLNYTFWIMYYFKKLTKVYDVILNGEDSSFNDVYSKAWFLHSFY